MLIQHKCPKCGNAGEWIGKVIVIHDDKPDEDIADIQRCTKCYHQFEIPIPIAT